MKKRALLSIILSAALLMSMLSGCGSKKETEAADAQTSYIGIISAMQNEIDLLLGEADIERTDTIGGVDYYVGKLCGRDVVIRAMSDKADGNAHESFDNMGDIAADNSSRIIMQMLKDD